MIGQREPKRWCRLLSLPHTGRCYHGIDNAVHQCQRSRVDAVEVAKFGEGAPNSGLNGDVKRRVLCGQRSTCHAFGRQPKPKRTNPRLNPRVKWESSNQMATSEMPTALSRDLRASELPRRPPTCQIFLVVNRSRGTINGAALSNPFTPLLPAGQTRRFARFLVLHHSPSLSSPPHPHRDARPRFRSARLTPRLPIRSSIDARCHLPPVS